MFNIIRAVLLLAICTVVSSQDGMDCSFGTKTGFVEKLINTCPPLFDSDKKYCCYNINQQSAYCCDAEEFAIKTGLGIIVPAVAAVVVVVMFIICCISCLCCACCPWYKRRHRGTVYGQVQGPSVVQVIRTQAPAPQSTPQQAPHNAYAYPANQMAMPQYNQPPPQYTAEAYSKQAPYNPGYGQ